MIVEPFTFDAYTARDFQAVRPAQQRAIARALRDGMFLIPAAYKCSALGLTPDGDYVAIRLGVYSGRTLVGAWWLGGHVAAQGHTAANAKLYARLCPGPVTGHEATSWTGTAALLFVKHLLHNVLPTREGGTVQFVGFDYAFDPAHPDNPGSLLSDIDATAAADTGLRVARTTLASGVPDNRWTLAP